MKGDLNTRQDNSRFSIVRPKKMDVDNQGQQRTNVSVKSKCYGTAQRELIRGHTLCSQVLLLPRKRKGFHHPSITAFSYFSTLTNPELRNPQTTPSKKRWIFFPKAFPPCNAMLQHTKAEKNGYDKTTLYPAARSWGFMMESPES